jgi:hypothetical protein
MVRRRIVLMTLVAMTIVTIALDVSGTLFVDTMRSDVGSVSPGSITAWAFVGSTWGRGVDVNALNEELNGKEVVAMLGYFAEYETPSFEFPSPFSVMALLMDTDGSLSFVDPKAELLNADPGRSRRRQGLAANAAHLCSDKEAGNDRVGRPGA